MKRAELTTQLNKLWQEKHYEYLQKCFMEKQSYFRGSFKSVSLEKNIIVIDETPYNQETIKKIIIDYYSNDTKEYHSCVGDVVYMFLTDLVETDVNILKEIEKNEITS